ncbi:YeaC family protein [Neptunicella marina]|uniref:DUF1315 family protein n=1 Tax=Neptunicella marina TaxID=2125989 RepID=A0A8J6IY53_9ALTE|nr:DUF1315 family protein [Neptunicella marina]MBC3767293.1 DUF1315 family protein [Neptunicella marina]
MSMDTLLKAITPEIYQNLSSAVETGKWPDGTPLTEEQKANSMQMVMLYQAKVLKSNEHMSIGENGEIVHKSKRELKQELADEAYSKQSIVRFKSDDI